jgi:DNA-binding IclR family transcriptional regulator
MTLRAPAEPPDLEAIEFVRFCRQRRRVAWPELYDEMAAVAGRGLFRGYGLAELGERGIGFSLFDTPRLAALVASVIAVEGPVVRVGAARRGRAVIGGAVLGDAPSAEAGPAREPAERAAAVG